MVPGDVILLRAGDKIPADARLIEAINLQVEEAALTGESVPVEKITSPLQNGELSIGDRRNMVYGGTAATYGRGRALVTGIGSISCFGVGTAALIDAVASGATGVAPIARFDTSGCRSHCGALIHGFDPAAFVPPLKLRSIDGVRNFGSHIGRAELGDEVVGPAGPTTATRMDKFTKMMLDQGLLAMVGKAERGTAAIEAIKEAKSAYLMAVGGAAYLVARAIKDAKIVGFGDLGMEAIYEFDVKDMPVTVAVDATGTSVHHTAPLVWREKIAREKLLENA